MIRRLLLALDAQAAGVILWARHGAPCSGRCPWCDASVALAPGDGDWTTRVCLRCVFGRRGRGWQP